VSLQNSLSSFCPFTFIVNHKGLIGLNSDPKGDSDWRLLSSNQKYPAPKGHSLNHALFPATSFSELNDTCATNVNETNWNQFQIQIHVFIVCRLVNWTWEDVGRRMNSSFDLSPLLSDRCVIFKWINSSFFVFAVGLERGNSEPSKESI